MLSAPLFAVAHAPTPLLNTQDFRFSFGGHSGTDIPLDSQRLLRSVEIVAFPGSKFTVIEQVSDHIVRATTQEYPGQDVFVDRRFLKFVGEEPKERARSLPSMPMILNGLESLVGTRYIWGGNWPAGIPSLLEYYPPKVGIAHLDPLLADTWQLKGVDCSGLLYYVSNGVTPRNTSSLVNFGRTVPIAGKQPDEIVHQLNDLDLIVWRGHVVIVYDQERSIESFAGKGVIKQSLQERIEELMQEKKRVPVDEYAATVDIGDRFVVRRWHPDNI